MIKKIILPILSALFLCSGASAVDRTYCGRITCASVLSGCQVQDNHTNPIVLIRSGGDTRMSRALSQAIESLAFKCACVVGSVRLETAPDGSTYVGFTSASSAYPVAESRCRNEGL